MSNLVKLYEEMMSAVHKRCHAKHDESLKAVDKALDEISESYAQKGDFSRKDVNAVKGFLLRDLHDLAEFISEEDEKLAEDWLSFDIKLAEDRTWETFLAMADLTRVELATFNRRLQNPGDYNASEITGLGTLECSACGRREHFYKAAVIEPCQQCGNQSFFRVKA